MSSEKKENNITFLKKTNTSFFFKTKDKTLSLLNKHGRNRPAHRYVVRVENIDKERRERERERKKERERIKILRKNVPWKV